MKAQPIQAYEGPQWLISPVGHSTNISKSDIVKVLDPLVGWDEYTHVVETEDDLGRPANYLVQLPDGFVPTKKSIWS